MPVPTVTRDSLHRRGSARLSRLDRGSGTGDDRYMSRTLARLVWIAPFAPFILWAAMERDRPVEHINGNYGPVDASTHLNVYLSGLPSQ